MLSLTRRRGLSRISVPVLKFTRNADTGTSPLITASTGNDDEFQWTGPNGIFIGKQPNISNFVSGDFTLRSRKWDKVTEIDFSNRKLTKFEIQNILSKLTSLSTLNINSNSSLVINNLNLWVLPSSLATISVATTSVSGDISGWVPNAMLATLYTYSTSVTYGTSGFLSKVTRNSSLYRMENCALTTAMVDRVLADCVASNTSSSTLNIAGTNQAPTDGASNADYLHLTGTHGWTVTISS